MESFFEKATIRASSCEEALINFKTQYPREELWRLAVEGYLYTIGKEQGWISYERREAGCLKSFFNALNYALQGIEDKAISLGFLLELHRLVVFQVDSIDVKEGGKFRQKEAFFNLAPRTSTKEGLKDLIECIKRNDLKSAYIRVIEGEDNPFSLDSIIGDEEDDSYTKDIDELINNFMVNEDDEIALVYYASSTSQIENLVNTAIVKYNDNIEQKKTIDDKLLLIGQTVEFFERIHPFPDGNGRVFANILLCRLLIQNGFPPATFYEANLFDSHGHHIEVLKQAIENTQLLYRQQEEGPFLFNFNTKKEMDVKDQQWMLNLVEETGFISKNIQYNK